MHRNLNNLIIMKNLFIIPILILLFSCKQYKTDSKGTYYETEKCIKYTWGITSNVLVGKVMIPVYGKVCVETETVKVYTDSIKVK